MRGLILANAYSTNEEAWYQPFRLKEEFAKLKVETDIKRNDFFPCRIENSSISYYLEDYDFCIFLDKDKYVLQALSQTKIPLFNSYYAITTCDDKMTTYITLSGNGIKMPKTLPGLLCYSEEETIKESTVDFIEKEFGYPLILKNSYGSLGRGVFLIKNKTELVRTMNAVKCSPHLYQEFIKSSFGKDVRIIVIGDKVIGGMLRYSDGDFRSNLGAGGHGKPYPLTAEMEILALKISRIIGLDFCGIDILLGENENPVVCEVNSNAFFSGFEHVTGINVAKLYAEHILRKLQSD